MTICNNNNLLLSKLNNTLFDLVSEGKKLSDDIESLYFSYKKEYPCDKYGLALLKDIVFSDLPTEAETYKSAIRYFRSKT